MDLNALRQVQNAAGMQQYLLMQSQQNQQNQQSQHSEDVQQWVGAYAHAASQSGFGAAQLLGGQGQSVSLLISWA